MADVASELEMRLNRLGAADGRRWAGAAASGAIILAWVVQFLLFSLERLLREPQAESWDKLGARAIVTLAGVIISVAILRILQRCAGMSFFKRALLALALAIAGAGLHSIINSLVFLTWFGPHDPGTVVSAESFAALVYLFGWVYLAVTVILLSLIYGEELLHRERRIAELAGMAGELDALKRLHGDAGKEPFVWVRKVSQTIRLDASDIDWIAAEGEYVRLHSGPDSYLERQSISAMGQQLAPFGFVRIHRSAIVNADRIDSLTRTRWGAMQLHLRGGTEHRVSRTYQPAVRAIVRRS